MRSILEELFYGNVKPSLLYFADLSTDSKTLAVAFATAIICARPLHITLLPNYARKYRFRILSSRPHENNPNILLFGESFGLFVLFEYPNFNSKK